MSETRGRVLIAALLAVEVVALAGLPGLAGTPFPALAVWALAFAAYAAAAAAIGRADGAEGSVRLLWIGAIALRLALLSAAPDLSEDVYRYMWDGWVQIHGVNPFAFPPAAPELAPLRTAWWPLINHPTVPTLYPPVAQIAFAVLAAAGRLADFVPPWLAFKIAWIGCDLGAGWMLGRLVTDARARVRILLLYLWSPLLVTEVAWSGHLEPLGLLAMLAVLHELARGRARMGGVALGLGAAVKFAPLAAVPALWRERGWTPAVLAVALPVLLYLPYAGAGARLFEGLGTYVETWRFNPGLFRALEAIPWAGRYAREVGAGGVVAVALWAAWRRWPVGRALFWTIGAGLLLSPTIHPWYVLWVLPFACLYGSRGWILLSGTVWLAYAGRDAYLVTGTWPDSAWLALLIHGPPLALLAHDARRSPGGGAGPAAAPGA